MRERRQEKGEKTTEEKRVGKDEWRSWEREGWREGWREGRGKGRREGRRKKWRERVKMLLCECQSAQVVRVRRRKRVERRRRRMGLLWGQL